MIFFILFNLKIQRGYSDVLNNRVEGIIVLKVKILGNLIVLMDYVLLIVSTEIFSIQHYY